MFFDPDISLGLLIFSEIIAVDVGSCSFQYKPVCIQVV